MISHSEFPYPCVRMDLIFRMADTIGHDDREVLRNILHALLSKFLTGDLEQKAVLSYYWNGTEREVPFTDTNLQQMYSLFVQDYKIDMATIFVWDGAKESFCLHYDNPNLLGITRKKGREEINTLSLSMHLGLFGGEFPLSEQQKWVNTMISLYQGLGGFNAAIGIQGIPSLSIRNGFDIVSGHVYTYEKALDYARGAFWGMIFNDRQLHRMGGYEALVKAVPFYKSQVFRQPKYTGYEEFAVCFLSERMDQCSIESLRVLYQFLKGKDMVPDVKALDFCLNNPGEFGDLTREDNMRELNKESYILHLL